MKKKFSTLLIFALTTHLCLSQQQPFYDVTPGNGNGVRLWANEAFKIHMGNSAEYLYGPVSDYSIKMNMSNDAGRGWTWGVAYQTPIAGLNTLGNMQIAGSFTAQGINLNRGAWPYIIFSENGTPGARIQGTGGNFAVTSTNGATNHLIVNSTTGSVGIGTISPGTNSKLALVGGALTISSSPFTADASLHIIGSFGAFDRLTQINPSLPNKPALNLMAAIDAAGNYNWWSWGVLNSGSWALQPSTSFGGSTGLFLDRSGNLGVGTSSPNQKLTVNGTIYGKEVKVDLSVPGPDYVFEKSYVLPSLEQVRSYIDQNKHLPEIPSALEMEKNGINLSEMNMLLLKKVEEMTLYIIEVNSKIELANQKIEHLERRLSVESKD